MDTAGRSPDHYAHTPYQHWDLVLAIGMGYLDGCSTKYVARWRRKNGRADLEKALHYADKLAEAARSGRAQMAAGNSGLLPDELVEEEVRRFADLCGLDVQEEAAVYCIATWYRQGHLERGRAIVRGMMRRLDGGDEAPDPNPVPLTEETHHAERAPSPDEGGGSVGGEDRT